MRQPLINRAAIYVKATAGNSREGAERSTQMDEAEQFCKERGLHVTARYSDDQGVREEFRKMMGDVHRLQRRPPHTPALVPGHAPGRRHCASRRAERGRRPAGTHRRQDWLRQAALAARGGACPSRQAGRSLPGVVLMLMPDEVRLRHARRLLTGLPVPALLALERDAALAGPGDPVRRLPSINAAIDLRSALARSRPGGALPAERPLARAALPEDMAPDAPGRDVPDHMLSALLKPAEKRALDLLYDWPWITPKDLGGLLGVSGPRVSQLVNPLEGFGLAARVAPAGRRLALTDAGLALLARRDRASVGVAKRRWSVTPADPQAPFGWRNVSGRRSRQLLRNVEHTAAVHAFIAALAQQSCSLGWELAQLDPPLRASRHFRHRDGLRSVHPDAFGVLRSGPDTWPFFLEWERRAVRPTTMADRLAPYLRYFSSLRPTDDHGAQPAVLVVFHDDIAATHFLRVAREEMDRTRVDVPLWVSHRRALERVGPMGRAWRTTGNGETTHAFPRS